MNCPVCSERLRETERYGIRLDICPGCKGFWLDRGELEGLLEWAASNGNPGTPQVRGAGEVESDEVRPTVQRLQQSTRDNAHLRQGSGHESDSDDDFDDTRPGRHSESTDRYKRGKKKRGSWLMDLFEGFGGD